jgi:hypothetical protein
MSPIRRAFTFLLALALPLFAACGDDEHPHEGDDDHDHAAGAEHDEGHDHGDHDHGDHEDENLPPPGEPSE